MLPSAKRCGVVAFLGGVALAVVAAAHAQTTSTTNNTFGNNTGIRIGPGVLLNDMRYNPMVSNPYNPSTTPNYTCYGYCPGGYSGNCYGGGYGYGGYCQDPYNGYLTGAASVISSQSQFVVARRQAQLINEQARQAAVDTQRKIYEEWKYERNDQATLEQIRRDAWKQAYERAIFQPPINDIWSADALNRIYDHASRTLSKGIAGSRIDIDDELLKHINFTTGVAGNIGALKNKGKLEWPAALNRKDFESERNHFNQLAEDAYRQGSANNKVESGVIEDMERYLGSVDAKLSERVRDLPPEDYIDAKHYLKDLQQAIKILKRPDVAKFLRDEFGDAVKAKDVGSLIKNMNNSGVRFAKARNGDEWAYNALYRALANFDIGLAAKDKGGEYDGRSGRE